jgi:hypothetical protein
MQDAARSYRCSIGQIKDALRNERAKPQSGLSVRDAMRNTQASVKRGRAGDLLFPPVGLRLCNGCPRPRGEGAGFSMRLRGT